MGKLEYLANVERDCDLWDVDQMLRESLEVRKNQERSTQKAIILYLDDTQWDVQFDIYWTRARMKPSEIIAVCEIVKKKMCEMLGDE